MTNPETLRSFGESVDVPAGLAGPSEADVPVASSNAGIPTVESAATIAWERHFAELVAFKAKHGHCRVSASDDKQLAIWIMSQRAKKSRLEPGRVQRLNELGLSLAPRSECWETHFAELVAFKKKHGHCCPTSRSGRLGAWVKVQREDRAEGRLKQDRFQRLDAMGFTWDVLEYRWEQRFAELAAFKRKHGHCRVELSRNKQLAFWVDGQRDRRNRLAPERVRRLEEIGFSWSPHSESWEKRLADLVAFKAKHGHCCPAVRSSLGLWVYQQRKLKAAGALPPDRVHRLEAIGFCWSVWDDAWERGYRELKSYIREYGHSVVSMDTHPKLATWMASQRSRKASGRLAPERVRRLEALGFQWCLEEDPWEGHFAALARFKAAHGHCRPRKTEFLSAWAVNQRKAKASGRLAPERVRRLDALGFQWNVISDLWERQFESLVEFKKKTGHASPPKKLGTLGTWAVMQRQARAKGQIDPERERRLEEIGFKWDPLAEYWDERFAELVAFKAEHGHCLVGKTSLGRWAASQRDHKAKGRLAPEYIKRLEEIGFPWEAKRPAEQDDDLVDHLLEFFREHGHFVVPNTAPHEGLYGRMQDRLNVLPKRPRFKQELLPLGFPLDQDEWAWERSFASVKAFRGRNGHCRLPEGSALGRWLDEQRELAAREDLDLDREARLKNAGILAGNGGTA